MSDAAADIDDHVAMRFGDWQSGANRRRHRFFNQINFRRLCAIGRVFNCPPFDLSNFRRNADNYTRADPRFPVVSLANEVLQHLLGNFEVRDHAIFHRTNGDDVAGRSAQHVFSVTAHCLDLVGHFIDCHDRRFGNNDAAPLSVNKCICRPEVDRQIVREIAENFFEHVAPGSKRRSGNRGNLTMRRTLSKAVCIIAAVNFRRIFSGI